MTDMADAFGIRLGVEPAMLSTPVDQILVPVEVLDQHGMVVATVAATVHPPDREPGGFRFDDGRWLARRVAAEVLAPAVAEPVVDDPGAGAGAGADPAGPEPLAQPGALVPPPPLLHVARQVPGSWVTRRGLEWVVSLPATVIGRELEARGIGDPMPAHQAAEILDSFERDPHRMPLLDPMPGLDPDGSLPGRPVIRRSFVYGVIILVLVFLVAAVVIAASAGNGT